MSGPSVHALIALREAVFVVEQRCAYQEADALDVTAEHLLAYGPTGLVGCLRVLPPSEPGQWPAIGRLLAAADHRGQGLARRLMDEALSRCADRWPARGVTLSAQRYLVAFYESLGFATVGAGYLEDGIPHIAMQRPPGPGQSPKARSSRRRSGAA